MTTTIFGIGDAGFRVLSIIAKEDLKNLTLVVLNTHLQNKAEPHSFEIHLIGKSGLGSGGNPAIGKQAVEHSANDIHALLQPVTKLMLVCGMGGGTGTGATPAIARYATALGIPTAAVVSLPYAFEGMERRQNAERWLPELRQFTDETVVVDNYDLHKWQSKMPTGRSAFNLSARFLAWNTLTRLV